MRTLFGVWGGIALGWVLVFASGFRHLRLGLPEREYGVSVGHLATPHQLTYTYPTFVPSCQATMTND